MAVSPSASDDDDSRVAIGSVLDGRYRIDALIGSGGMGRIYRGEHTGIGRSVAIKVLHQDLHRNREASQRFQREAIASGRLDHPNITNIYDFGVLGDGACYLVMELLEGETLGERLERDTRLPWREAVEILRGALLGLRHAHDRGVVHRDIKPDNIYLARKDGDLIIKILDFGIAKLRAGSADDPASTRAGITVGTPAYLSPEQAVGGEITPASDLYSASIVLYEMLAGRAPFEDKDPLAMLGAHVSRTPPLLAEVAPDIDLPPGLEDVMRAGLVKAARDRIRSAKDYIGMLDGVVAATRRLRTGPVIAVSPTAATAELAAIAADLHAGGASVSGASPVVSALPGDPRSGSPASAPDQSVRIQLGPAHPTGAAALSGEHELPPQARAVSLAELSETVPRKWLVIGGVVVVLLIIGAIILAVSSGGDYKPAPAPGEGSAAVDPASARELALKALLLDLQNGATCAERKKAIGPIQAFGDPRAIEALKAAKQRLRPGSPEDNTCLVRDADVAIKALSGVK